MTYENNLKTRTINKDTYKYIEYKHTRLNKTYTSDYYVEINIDDRYKDSIKGSYDNVFKEFIDDYVNKYNSKKVQVLTYLDKDKDLRIKIVYGSKPEDYIKASQFIVLTSIVDYVKENNLSIKEDSTYNYYKEHTDITNDLQEPNNSNGLGIYYKGEELELNMEYTLPIVSNLKGAYGNTLDRILDYYKIKEVIVGISSYVNGFNVLGSLRLVKEDGKILNTLEGIYVETFVSGGIGNISYEEFKGKEELGNIIEFAYKINGYVSKKEYREDYKGKTKTEISNEGFKYYLRDKSCEDYLYSFIQEAIERSYIELFSKDMLGYLVR